MSLINNINKESKIVGRNKHILINDAGIGSNRLVMSNNYLNYFNYYHKNLIKMNKIREIKNIERKKNFEKFKKDKIVPGLTFSSAYYKYTGNDYEFFENDKTSNATFKKAKINYLQDLLFDKDDKVEFIIDSKRNKNSDEKNIYKTLKLSRNVLLNDKDKIINNQSYNNKIYNTQKQNKLFKDNDDMIYYRTNNNNLFKNKSIKCKIIFGKTLHNDLELQKMNKNKKRNLSYNTNGRYQTLDTNYCNLNTKSVKMKLLKKNKLLPLIK